MSITDELRKYAGNFYLFRYKDVREKLDAIADRIDAEYQKAIRELNNLADASMILLVDADGVPIHLGDMMHGTCPSGKYVCGEVSAIGDNKLWLRNVQFSLRPDYMHHHHEPTVEDVLLEFASRWDDPMCYDRDEMVEQYATKLRLVEDGEEQ